MMEHLDSIDALGQRRKDEKRFNERRKEEMMPWCGRAAGTLNLGSVEEEEPPGVGAAMYTIELYHTQQ